MRQRQPQPLLNALAHSGCSSLPPSPLPHTHPSTPTHRRRWNNRHLPPLRAPTHPQFTDADGNRRLFKVAPLCDALQRQLSPARPPTADTRPANGGRGAGRGGSGPAPPHGAPSVSTSGHPSVSSSAPPSVSAPGAPDGPVCFGNLHQLDFLVLAFLQGNDYLPKLRGAQLPRMWARLARLLRSADFAGQHLLRPMAEEVEVNVHLLVELAGGTCETIASPEEEWEGEEEEEEQEEGEEELAWGSHGAGREASTAGVPGASAAARPPPCSSARKRPREALPRYDVDGYLHCLAWCAAMYLTGTCPDFSVAYTARAAPTAAQLARWLVVRDETVTGRACMPVYRLPAASRMGVPMAPDVFSLCLLPAVAAAYLPRPLHALMEAGAPLSDIFHANQVRHHPRSGPVRSRTLVLPCAATPHTHTLHAHSSPSRAL